MKKTYLGAKIINAEPMERDGVPGYHVVYPDGYDSWSPKDVFEDAYHELTEEAKDLVSPTIGLVEIAKICHEANRAYCQALGDDSQEHWDNCPDWQQSSAVDGVVFHIGHPDASAAASHVNWMMTKHNEGWKHGPLKDEHLKTHPCMVAFEELPVEQQAKDYIFRAIVHVMKNLGE